MKNIVLSAVAVLAMSSFAVAGGDIAPVEEPVVVVEPVVDDSSFYLGLAYSVGNWEIRDSRPANSDIDYDLNAIMLQAGYNFNKYIAIEGRYWFGIETSTSQDQNENDVSIDAWGIYIKPQYPVTDAFTIYGLLGYANAANVNLDDTDLTDAPFDYDISDFSWGAGIDYAFSESISIFVDYVSIYDDKPVDNNQNINYDITTWNFGVTYTF